MRTLAKVLIVLLPATGTLGLIWLWSNVVPGMYTLAIVEGTAVTAVFATLILRGSNPPART